MKTLTKVEAEALAALIVRLRPEWRPAGVLSALEKAAPTASAFDVACAAIRLAEDATVLTPGLLPQPGPHWRKPDGSRPARRGDHAVPCHDHPGRSHPCPECADRHTPMPDDVRAEIAHAVEEAKRALPVDTRTPLDPTRPTWTAPPRTARP